MRQVRLRLRGPPREALASVVRLIGATLRVCVGRILHDSSHPARSLDFEIATVFFRAQGRRAFGLAGDGSGLVAARRMIDTLVLELPHLRRVGIVRELAAPLAGRWFDSGRDGPFVLHFHGGGYVFSPATTDNLIAAVARAIGGRIFVPDYRLAPEHPFPCQLEDAVRSYRWLLSLTGSPCRIVLTGDSSGGHLVLALLLTLSQCGLPQPAASVAISPWTDPGGGGRSLRDNALHDWMTADMLDRMAAWAGRRGGAEHPLFRLTQADLSPLRRVLVHSGGSEICRDMVLEFVARAQAAGADVQHESWNTMNHNFHGFGESLEQSRQALGRIASFVTDATRSAAVEQEL